jgi:hypothetical protein
MVKSKSLLRYCALTLYTVWQDFSGFLVQKIPCCIKKYILAIHF